MKLSKLIEILNTIEDEYTPDLEVYVIKPKVRPKCTEELNKDDFMWICGTGVNTEENNLVLIIEDLFDVAE